MRGFARLAIVALLVVGCVGAAAPPSPTPAPVGHTLSGTLVLRNDGYVVRHGLQATSPYLSSASPDPARMFPCSGTGGFDDVGPGAQITVVDQAGTILALGAAVDDPDATAQLIGQPGQMWRTECFFKFSVAAIPDAAFYTVKIGSRGGPTYSPAQLDANAWNVALTL